MYDYEPETIVDNIEAYIEENPIDLKFDIDTENIVSTVSDYLSQNPIKLSFDDEVITSFISDIQSKFEALKLEASIAVNDNNTWDYITSSFGLAADLGSIFKKDNVTASLKKINDICLEGHKSVGAYSTSLKGISTAFEAIGNVSKDAKQNIKQIHDVFTRIGENIGEGIIKGIKGSKLELTETVKDLATNVETAIKTTLEIKSPSKVMEKLGNYVSEGLADGIEEGGKFVEDASKQLCDGCEEQFKDLEKATDKLNGKKISFGGGLAILAGVATTVIGLFQNLMENNEEFSEKMQEVWALVQEAFQPVVDAFTYVYFLCSEKYKRKSRKIYNTNCKF